MDNRDPIAEFEAIHAAGIERHPKSWLRANERAVVTLIGAKVDVGKTKPVPFDVSRPLNKAIVSLVVLRILDAMESP